MWEDFSLPSNKAADDTLLSKVEQLKELNITFESTEDPIILENIKSEMESLIGFCIMHENLYPTSIVKLKDSEIMQYKVKERYNERLYLTVKKSLEQYKSKMSEQISESDRDYETESIFSQIQHFQSYLEKTAINYDECLSGFAALHDEVEDLFSNLIHNDLDLSEAFTIILEKITFKDYITAIANLIRNNELNKDNLDKILNEYHIYNIRDIKLDLLDLILSYVYFVIDTHIITEKERNNIETLKLYFRIKEGDFYKYRREQIKSVCQKQFARLYQNTNYSDELFKVEIQSIFDLSYSQLEKFKKTK
jgi:hypothetical protein